MPTLIQFAKSHTIQFATAVTALGVVQQDYETPHRMAAHLRWSYIFLVTFNRSNYMPTLVQLIKSKTLIFSTALTVLGLAQGSLGVFNLDPMQQSYALMGIGIVSAVLRFLTTAPLSEK